MAEQDIRQLFAKYIDGSIGKAEYKALLQYFELPEHVADTDQLLYQAIAKESSEVPVSEKELEEVMDAAYQKLERRIIGRTRKVWRLLRYAAAILIAATAATWIFFGDQIKLKPGIAIIQSEDIAPGGNRATLTLADGRTIDLSEAQTGIVLGDGITYSDGSEVVNAGKESLMADVSHLMSVSTPKGGTYQITLPDGSNVWLNAASTLTYPSHFSGEERIVELIGEAYFEVSEQAHNLTSSQKTPFKVITNGQTVEVLGTQFNISAYPDEPTTKTTLVEGSVRLRAGATGASVSLVPGEQGLFTDGTIETKQVNTLKYTSWKDGLFYFRDAGIDEVAQQLERWYDVAVVYEGYKPTNQFTGEIPRNRHASEVLAMLQYFGVQYRIDGKTITLSNNPIK